MEHAKSDAENKYQFVRKSKKYKTKYFDALKQLIGEASKEADNVSNLTSAALKQNKGTN